MIKLYYDRIVDGVVIPNGIPDKFVDHASREEMLEMTGLDTKGILVKVEGSLS